MRWILMGVTTAVVLKAVAWGDHGAITRAAVDALSERQKMLLGSESEELVRRYCFIPDRVGVDLENRPLVEGFLSPEPLSYSGRFENFHLPFGPVENQEILLFQVQNVLGALSTNDVPLAARYMGILAHMLEDWTCPAHATVNDNMFTLLTQFFPPPQSMRYRLFHGPIESGGFAVEIPGYEPESLGSSAEEIAFNLLWKSQQGTAFARSRTGGILSAIYNGDDGRSKDLQKECAIVGAKLVADAFRTLLDAASKTCRVSTYETLSLTNVFPLEQPALYWPQRAFFSKPYWGHPTIGTILKGGRDPVGLVLSWDGKRQNVEGIGCGVHTRLTYVLPRDVYERFDVVVGLHSDLGEGGQVVFRIYGNGVSVADVTIRDSARARPLHVSLAGITNLVLQATAVPHTDPSCDYAVWGNPLLLKKSLPFP